MQGMTAVMATWAHEQADAAADAMQASSNIAADEPWPASWGTLAESIEASPFSIVHLDKMPGGWEARAQTQKMLSVPSTTDFCQTLFSPLGYDAQVGFTTFEKYSRYAMYQVAVPEFNDNAEVDGSFTPVPVGSVSRGHISVAGVCFLSILKDYVVRLFLYSHLMLLACHQHLDVHNQ